MGAVNSVCEGCFGKEVKPKDQTSSSKNPEDKRKYQELKSENQGNAIDGNKQAESAKSSQSTLKKQTTGSSMRSSIKKKDDAIPDKNKKMTIKDFDLIRVKLYHCCES